MIVEEIVIIEVMHYTLTFMSKKRRINVLNEEADREERNEKCC